MIFQTCWNPFARVAHNNFMNGTKMPRLFWHLTHMLPGVLALPSAYLIRHYPTPVAIAGMWFVIVVAAVLDKIVQPRWHGILPSTFVWRGWQVDNYPDFFGDLWMTALPAILLAGQGNPWLLIPTYLATVVSDPYPDN